MHQSQSTGAPGSGVPLWHLYRQGQHASCELVRVPVGFEGRFFLDGRFLYSYQFTDADDVFRWAFAKQADFRQRGWTLTNKAAARHSAEHGETSSLPVAS
jgi:hypothetical protein